VSETTAREDIAQWDALRAEGRRECQATHGAIYSEGYDRARAEWYAAGEQHGRDAGLWQGIRLSVLVGLVAVAVWWWRR
jgi:hypothetical protein